MVNGSAWGAGQEAKTQAQESIGQWANAHKSICSHCTGVRKCDHGSSLETRQRLASK